MKLARHASPRALPALLGSILSLVAIDAGAQTLQKTALTIDGNGNGVFELGETIQYTLTFTNTGTFDLTNVVIGDDSSACIGIDIASLVIEPASGGTDASSGNAVKVNLVSPLPVGDAVTITFVAAATADGSCCNQATWISTELPGGVSDRNPADTLIDQPTCHFVVASTGLEYDAIIDKQVLAAGCIAPGSTVGFRIHVQNTGQRPLRNAVFSDVLPAGFTNVTVDAGLSYDPATNRVFSAESTYGVGQTSEYTYQATLPCTASGALLNTGVLTFEDNGGTVSTRTDTETVKWGQPDLSDSTKTWADDPSDGDARVSPGETVSFAITIRNTGACEALNVSALDDLDPRFLSSPGILAISDGGFYDALTARIEWNETTTAQLTAIPAGGSVTLSFTTQVDPATAGGSYLPNSVTITPLGNDSSCPGLPSVTRTIAMQNGDVAYGQVPPTTILLRNDFISCRMGALAVLADGGPSGIPVLQMRPAPQECSNPPAINTAHPQTDVIVNPSSPYVLADATGTNERCPQASTGSGRLLIIYELQDECTDTLRVTKDPDIASQLILTW